MSIALDPMANDTPVIPGPTREQLADFSFTLAEVRKFGVLEGASRYSRATPQSHPELYSDMRSIMDVSRRILPQLDQPAMPDIVIVDSCGPKTDCVYDPRLGKNGAIIITERAAGIPALREALMAHEWGHDLVHENGNDIQHVRKLLRDDPRFHIPEHDRLQREYIHQMKQGISALPYLTHQEEKQAFREMRDNQIGEILVDRVSALIICDTAELQKRYGAEDKTLADTISKLHEKINEWEHEAAEKPQREKRDYIASQITKELAKSVHPQGMERTQFYNFHNADNLPPGCSAEHVAAPLATPSAVTSTAPKQK